MLYDEQGRLVLILISSTRYFVHRWNLKLDMKMRAWLISLILLHIAACICAQHAPETPPLINRESSWCSNGSVTSTTVRTSKSSINFPFLSPRLQGECICSSHLGYFCEDSDVQSNKCQNGFGISFFHFSCMTCSCSANQAWIERKRTHRANVRKTGGGGGLE